ncbi:uncharacterized protein LOC142352814 isoform X2 [Convolutriloba macropyga]|uniref:uncharacterized protein LOC142352814 isoform X2 n=1 Tax=Convolutriloba macropyga TaxID=536237 RepID=UPI003F51E83A
MSQFKDAVLEYSCVNGLTTIFTESRIDPMPFLLNLVQLTTKTARNVTFCCLNHPTDFYRNQSSKRGITPGVDFADILGSTDLYQDGICTVLRNKFKESDAIVFDNILLLLVFLDFNVSMLQKFVVEVSQLAKMTVIGCTREPIFADFGKFVNFLKFRSDTVIDLSIMSGSTAAVGVDGKMSLKSCQVYAADASDEEIDHVFNLKVVDKEYLYKVVDRSILIYPLGSVY